ncbi:hypothetical protein ACFQDN_08735 [Pseudomonas asuensis]|nr:hypothetical protein [Pseudomonas asuensis]
MDLVAWNSKVRYQTVEALLAHPVLDEPWKQPEALAERPFGLSSLP